MMKNKAQSERHAGAASPWLRRIVRRLDLRAKPRDNVVPIKELFQLGLQLMDQAESTAKATTVFRGRQYRDGLILALSHC